MRIRHLSNRELVRVLLYALASLVIGVTMDRCVTTAARELEGVEH